MKQSVLILVLVLFTGCLIDRQKNDLPFSSEIWKKSDSRDKGRMSVDLENSKLLINKSKPEIKELLGSPDKDAADLWVYEIDKGEPLNYQLNVFFDKENDKVILSYVAN